MIDGPDMDFVEDVWLPTLAPLYDTWFRVDATGVGNIPADGPVLLVSNHSGNLPVDALMAQVAVHRGTGRWPRLLAGDVAYTVPGVGTLARRVGAVRADRTNAHALLDDGEIVADYPEGYRGLGKPYTDRYRLQRFGRGGFAALALRHNAPIVPVAVVGAEEIYPQLGSVFRGANLLGGEGVAVGIGRAEGAAPVDEAIEGLVMGIADMLVDGLQTPAAQLPLFFLGDRGAKRRAALQTMLSDLALAIAKGAGVPYVPVTPFFPWLGLLGAIPLPSKWTIDFMAPVDPAEWAAGYREAVMEPGSPQPAAHADAVTVLGLAEDIRGRIQERLLARLRTRRSAFY